MNDILKSDDQTRPDSHLILRGNPKTLIPSLRTPATARSSDYLTDQFTAYPYRNLPRNALKMK